MKENGASVCIVAGNAELGESLREMVRTINQYSCIVVSSLSCLQSVGADQPITLVFVDRGSEMDDFDQYSELLDRLPVATFGKPGGNSAALDTIESRARYQLRHPAQLHDLRRLFNHLESPGQGQKDADSARPLHLYRGLVGSSDAVQDLKSLIERAAPSRANILILGETGTGKEVVARNIHYRSANSGGPFVPVNCSAIPPDLLESELFGHKKGAFTGAISDRIGRFELASGGTLFLDEIGDMPLVLQVKLLRVLEERIIYPLGSDTAVPMTARLLAATHRNLENLVDRATFREDLYYRLNVVPIDVPPLRDRNEDIPHLARELSCRLKQEQNVSIEFTDAALDSMQQYRWPGNVRELANLIERLAVLHPDGCIDVEDLPNDIRCIADIADRPVFDQTEPHLVNLNEDFDLKEYLQLTEATLIRQALDCSGGVVTRAAEILHLRRTTLTEKVKRLGLGNMVKQAG